MNSTATRPLPALAAIAALLVLIPLIDALTPLGYAEWALYFIPVAATLFQPRPGVALGVGLIVAVLGPLGLVLSPPGVNFQMAVTNRSIGALAQVGVAIVIWRVLITRAQLQRLLWVQQREAAVSGALLGEPALEPLAQSALQALRVAAGADVGALYRLDGARLRLLAADGADRNALPEQRSAAEGLPAQVLAGRQPQVWPQLQPGHLDGHLQLVSALGRSAPRHLAIAPLLADGSVQGVVELGFVRGGADFERERELLQQVAEPIGLALRAAVYRQRLVELLEETQRQSEELQAQQEELRVSNEELEEQSRVLQESQARLEVQQAELEQTNVQLEEQTQHLERQKAALLQAQRDLALHAEQLEQASRYKSEFLANMSHELRTPLNSALILAKLLADNREATLTAQQVQYAQAIHDANNDLLALINDILDLSKIEAGHAELVLEALPLDPLLQRLQAQFQPLAEQKRLRLVVERMPGAPERMQADAQRLPQVLKNLLANALKFTERGEVALRVRAGRDGRVRFEVSDTGIGIPKPQQQVIFEAFRQADGSTSRRYGGTGLGLSISRELAQRMGGGIELDSEPGRGSCFTLELPVDGVGAETAPAPAAPAPTPAAAAPAPAAVRAAAPSTAAAPPAIAAPGPEAAAPALDDDRARRRHPDRLILAIEDDPAFGAVLLHTIRERGFDGVVAMTAGEGLQLARTLQPGGILLDIVLPDASGLSVLEQLKRDPATRHIPVHMVSGMERAHTALELGAIGHLMKPADHDALAQVIAQIEQRLQRSVRRLLIVEDDATLRDSLRRLLANTGVDIVAVGTVADALDALRRTSFDCMVTDLALPDASGYDLLERMAAMESVSFPPVIVYTGRALTRDEEQRLRRYSKSIIVKGARSPERLLDEVTLFLHSVETALPPERQRMLRQARQRDAVLDGRTLLLAEDDVRNIFALSGVFEPLGARLEVARNGREALERLQRGDVDLVLMDVMMPEMDGLEAMRRIRERPEWRNLPVIALTAKAMPEDRERCLEAGANDYIAKPIDVDKLVSLCRVWCPK